MIQFVKYQALGNDYIVIDPADWRNETGESSDSLARFNPSPERVSKLCDRHYGIGADGILWGPIPCQDADFGLRIFNPDGSQAENSGNGLRIFARYLWDRGMVRENPFQASTPGGIVRCQVHSGGERVTVEMGRLSFDSHDIPLSGSRRSVLNEELELEGRSFRYCAVSLGNPHCIILCDEISEADARRWGPKVEHEPRFRNRTNVQFMKVIDPHNLQIEIWERGAGYTLASGSSSCAAAGAAHRLGLCSAQVQVHMPGGVLDVAIDADDQVTLTGEVSPVFVGQLPSDAEMSKSYGRRTSVPPDLIHDRDFIEAILQTMDALVIVFDQRGRILLFNRACEGISGYSFEEVKGKQLWNVFLAQEDIRIVKAAYSGLPSGHFPDHGENRWIAKDGHYRDIAWSNMPLLGENGSIRAVIATGVDITARKQMEEELLKTKAELEKRVEERTEEYRQANRALLESEANLRSWVENARDYVVYRVAIDNSEPHGGHVVMVSPSIRQLVGIRDPYCFDCWFENIHPDDLDIVEEANRLAWEEGTPYNQVVRVFHPERGRWIWLNTISTPVFNDQGKLTHFNGLILDISEQKWAEEALQSQVAFETLITSISSSFINLEAHEIDQEIESSLQAIGKFTGMEHVGIYRFSEDGCTIENTHAWTATSEGQSYQCRPDCPIDERLQMVETIRRSEALQAPFHQQVITQVQAEEANRSPNLRSFLYVPMETRGAVAGYLSLESTRLEKEWSPENIRLLKMLGEIFVNAIAQKRALEIQAGQNRYLELMARGGRLTETLEALLRIIEGQSTGTLGLILLLDEDEKHLHIGASISLPEEYICSIEGLEIGPLVGSCGTACYRRERVIVQDIATDPRWEGLRELGLHFGLRACWSQPVFSAGGKVLGTFALYYRYPKAPSQMELRTIETAAHLVGVAIEHKQAQDALEQAYQTLEERVEERTRELEQRRRIAEGLRDILSILNSNQTLEAVLGYIVAQASRLLGSSASVMHHVNYVTHFVEIEASYGLPEEILDIRGFPLYSSPKIDQAILERKPYFIDRIQDLPSQQEGSEDQVTPEARRWRSVTTRCYNAYLAVPLIVGGEVYGSLAFYYADSREFSEEDVRLGVTFGDQVSLALENARLRSQAEQLAVIAERNRLARDLHDAVTQTLFSASLIAEVLPRLWERNPEEAHRRLEELRLLNRGALAEMRTLLLELRPASLLEAEIDEIFHHLRDAFTGRTHIPVQFVRAGVEELPPEVKVAFYRIAQEALNNIAKHAQASKVLLSLTACQIADARREIELLIRDNGKGFIPDCITTEHLGLEIMKERAGDIGAKIDIQTGIGQGTTITALWDDVINGGL